MSPTSIFAPASTPARSIFELSLLVLAIAGGIFVAVSALLTYASVRFRRACLSYRLQCDHPPLLRL